jgi:hypothetical protein
VAVELAAQLADLSGRAIGEHYGIFANAVVANRRRTGDAARAAASHRDPRAKVAETNIKVVSSGLTLVWHIDSIRWKTVLTPFPFLPCNAKTIIPVARRTRKT